MSSQLPAGWTQRESKSHGGRTYYHNASTGESTWTVPTSAGEMDTSTVQVHHILRKHAGSRRPSSWRCNVVTQSIDEARSQVQAYKTQLDQVLAEQGFEAMKRLFCKIAEADSDCSSHERGGDLGVFGHGQMQKAFDEASFALQVGQLSGLVETDSGVHILLRVR